MRAFTEHIDRAHHVCLDRLDRVVLVMNRRCGTRQIVDLIDLKQYRLRHVMADEFKSVVVQEFGDILLASGKKIVEADDFAAFAQQSFAQMRTDKSGTAGDKYAHNLWSSRKHLAAAVGSQKTGLTSAKCRCLLF